MKIGIVEAATSKKYWRPDEKGTLSPTDKAPTAKENAVFSGQTTRVRTINVRRPVIATTGRNDDHNFFLPIHPRLRTRLPETLPTLKPKNPMIHIHQAVKSALLKAQDLGWRGIPKCAAFCIHWRTGQVEIKTPEMRRHVPAKDVFHDPELMKLFDLTPADNWKHTAVELAMQAESQTQNQVQ